MSASKVSIIGAGISGLSVAQNLSPFPVDVTLIEQNPYPGGRAMFYGCKATDKCVHCGVCLLRDAVSRMDENPRLRVLYSSHLDTVARSGGGTFKAEVSNRPNAIDPEVCTSCGHCQEVCPEDAIEAIPGWKYVINDRCTACGKCVEACPVSAIEL